MQALPAGSATNHTPDAEKWTNRYTTAHTHRLSTRQRGRGGAKYHHRGLGADLVRDPESTEGSWNFPPESNQTEWPLKQKPSIGVQEGPGLCNTLLKTKTESKITPDTEDQKVLVSPGETQSTAATAQITPALRWLGKDFMQMLHPTSNHKQSRNKWKHCESHYRNRKIW